MRSDTSCGARETHTALGADNVDAALGRVRHERNDRIAFGTRSATFWADAPIDVADAPIEARGRSHAANGPRLRSSTRARIDDRTRLASTKRIETRTALGADNVDAARRRVRHERNDRIAFDTRSATF